MVALTCSKTTTKKDISSILRRHAKEQRFSSYQLAPIDTVPGNKYSVVQPNRYILIVQIHLKISAISKRLTMDRYVSITLILACVALYSSSIVVAFTTSGRPEIRQCLSPLSMAVVDIDGEAAFDKTVKSANGGLVIVDYSTTW